MPEKTQKGYDITIKDLFEGAEEALVEYLTGMALEYIQPLNMEFKRVEMRSSDFVVKGISGGKPAIYHIEFQSSDDPKTLSRSRRVF